MVTFYLYVNGLLVQLWNIFRTAEGKIFILCVGVLKCALSLQKKSANIINNLLIISFIWEYQKGYVYRWFGVPNSLHLFCGGTTASVEYWRLDLFGLNQATDQFVLPAAQIRHIAKI